MAAPEKLLSFPSPFPDETFPSWIARYHVLSGELSPTRTLKRLFGTSAFGVTSNLPSHLLHFFEQLPEGVMAGIDEIIERLTLLPYYSPFIQPSTLADVKTAMASGERGGVSVKLSFLRNSILNTWFARLCPACALEDLQQFGQPYWHRSHQLPGISVCVLHGCLLLERCGVCQHEIDQHNHLYLPHMICPNGHPLLEQIEPVASDDRRLLLATLSNALLQSTTAPIPLEKARHAYLVGLIDKGLAASSKKILQTKFHEAVEAYYGADFLANLGLPLQKSDCNDWLSQMRIQVRSPHPVKHLLVIGFLFGTWDNFIAAMGRAQIDTPKRQYQPRQRPDDEWIEQLRDLLDRQGRSVKETAAIFGKSTYYISVTAEKLGIRQRLKKPREGVHFDRILNEMLSTEPLDQIAARHGLSVKHLKKLIYEAGPEFQQQRNRILGSTRRDEYRRRIEAFLQGKSGISKVDIKRAALKELAWLETHDQVWLDKKLETHQVIRATRVLRNGRHDWDQKDKNLSEALKSAAARLLDMPGRPKRVGVEALRHALGNPKALRDCSRLPLTAALMNQLVEQKEDFHRRLIQWTVNEMTAKGWRLSKASILRYVNLREKELSPVIIEMIEQIVSK